MEKLLLLALTLAIGLTFTGCNDETKQENMKLKSENSDLSKQVNRFELELEKRKLEADNTKGLLAESKAREQALSEQLRGTEVALKEIQNKIASLQKDLADTKVQLSTYVEKEKKEVEAKALEASKPLIEVQASVSFKNGDTKPVANANILVLSKSFYENLKAHFPKENQMERDFRIYCALTQGASQTDPNTDLGNPLEIAVAKGKTNINGQASIQVKESGIYWIFLSTAIGKSLLMWDLQVELKGGKNIISLDSGNTADIIR